MRPRPIEVAVRVADLDLDADVRAVLAALSIEPVDAARTGADLLVTDATGECDPVTATAVVRVCAEGDADRDASVLRLPSQLDLLVESLQRPSGGTGLALVCAGAVGGCGTSTVAALTAVRGGAVLVEADPYGLGSDLLLGVEGRLGLRLDDIRSELGGVDPRVLLASVPSTSGGVGVLARVRDEERMDPATVTAVACRVVGALRAGGTTVVVDAGRVDGSEPMVGAADHLVVVTRADLAGAVAARCLVRRHGGPTTLLVAPVRRGGIEAVDVAAACGCRRWHRLPHSAALARACGSGDLDRRTAVGGLGVPRAVTAVIDRVLREAGADGYRRDGR